MPQKLLRIAMISGELMRSPPPLNASVWDLGDGFPDPWLPQQFQWLYEPLIPYIKNCNSQTTQHGFCFPYWTLTDTNLSLSTKAMCNKKFVKHLL